MTTTEPAQLQTDLGRRGARPRKRGRRDWLPYLYILPAFLIMAFITFYPIGYQVWMAFTDFALQHLRTRDPNVVGFQNFTRILFTGLPLPNYNFWRILAFNLLWTFVNVVFHVVIGIAVAVALNIKRLPGKRVYRSLFILPWALPALVSGMIWHNMWHERFGAINLLLRELGLQTNIRWLQDTSPVVDFPQLGVVLPLAFFAVLITNVWLGWPYMMAVATGALQSIPEELYEAAIVDGATGWQKLRFVTLPMLKPAMIPAIMIGTMLTFNQFNVIYFVTGGGPLGLTEILVTQGFKLVNQQGWYGVAAAFNIIVFGILAVITLITNRISQATEPYTA
jgi:arabinogalactan oligomer / maltooligosaccharide transport system permease protein